MVHRKIIMHTVFLFNFSVALTLSINLLAQEAAHTTDVIKIGLLDPGVSFEKSVGKKQTLLLTAYMSPSFSFLYSSSFGTTTDFRLEPVISLQYRYFYNGGTRARKDKFTERNSMNYLTPVYNVVFSKRRMSVSHYEETSMRPLHTLAISWGLQRNYKNRFSLDFSFGPGVLFTRSSIPDNNGNPIKSGYSSFTVLSEINIGFWLSRKVPVSPSTTGL